MSGKAALALNALSEVTLTGISPAPKAPDSGLHTTNLRRQDVPVDLIKPFIRDPGIDKDNGYVKMPPRPPSQLPPPGTAHLRASLGRYLGHGHSSIVFDLEDVQISGIPSDTIAPPLVVKFARLNRVTSLLREHWFYDDMECLQGVSIPRNYGYFECQMSNESSIRQQLLALQRMYPPEDDGEENVVIFREELTPPLHPMLRDRRDRRDIVAVTILEKLGPHLPLGEQLPQETKDDLESLFDDFGHLCVNNTDGIRWENIMKASDALPSLPSPFTQKVHQWRAIDLEQAIKANVSMVFCQIGHFCGLSRVYHLVESWEPPDWSEEDSDNGECGIGTPGSEMFPAGLAHGLVA